MTGKNVPILLLLLLIFILSGYLLLHHEWTVEQDILYLKDGTTIVADETWEGGSLIYYQQDGTTTFLAKENVEYLGKGDVRIKRTGQDIATQYIRQHTKKIMQYLDIDEPEIAMAKEWFSQTMDNGLQWILFLVVVASGFIGVRVKLKASKKDIISDGLHLEDSDSDIRRWNFDDLSDMEKIVSFFLDLYKLQIGAPQNAISDFFQADIKAFGDNKVYQLRVKHNGDWTERRMTIGPLGEESGSKSKCYYVIYDVHMVLKIPPEPLQDLNTYIENISKEGHIVDKLSPRECITPRVSVIMQRVYSFTRKDLPPDILEERYIKLLGKRADLQNYLKIGNSFVFFMDLSKYFFLGHIISNLHDMDQKMRDEIMLNPRIIWDVQSFGGRYGQKKSDVCMKIQDVFAEYESELGRQQPGETGKTSVLQYQIKEWFLIHLAGNKISSNDKDMTPRIAETMNALIETIFSRHDKVIGEYRATVRSYVQSVSFSQSKPQIESIVSNILDLLAWLGKKKVAMRDLKPDNLLVAGDTSNYPQFLSSADQFTIGLIDVETAVDYEAADNNAIPQPQLGGTPNYATPTHLFKNEALLTVFSGLPRILHLQDWQAIVAIIYKVATGETLFRKTGKLMPAIISRMKKSKAENMPVQDIINNAGAMFWPGATAEFNANIKEKENLLNLMKVTLSDDVLNMIKAETLISCHYFTDAIAEGIDSQNLFQDSKTRHQLRIAPQKHILQILKKWKKELKTSRSGATHRRIVFLQGLEQIKQQAEFFTDMQKRLDQPSVTLTLSELLVFMFNTTRHAMFRTDFQASLKDAPAEVPDNGDDHEYEKTL